MAYWLILLAAAAAYLFLVRPGMRRKKQARTFFSRRFFAHRGLHGEGIPENSLPAFRKAAEKGCGIELDARLTRDKKIVIHHDPDGFRLCGDPRLLADLTLDEVSALRLNHTEERVPTLKNVLEAVKGRVPLLIEMKSDRGNGDLPRLLDEEMRGYDGPWCVESFDPRQLFWFRVNGPKIIRGQLAFDPFREKREEKGLMYRLGAHLTMNFLSRPDFIAYGYQGDKNPTFSLVRRLFRPVTAAWTVKDPGTAEKLKKRYDAQIFEGFCPDFLKDNQEKETKT